jgi:hypothetical protein
MAGPAQASVVCESGTKISYTEPSTLGADGRARFSSVMRMVRGPGAVTQASAAHSIRLALCMWLMHGSSSSNTGPSSSCSRATSFLYQLLHPTHIINHSNMS